MEPTEKTVRITLPGAVPDDKAKVADLLERIGNPGRIAEAIEENQNLSVPLGGQRIELAHNKLKRGEIFLLKVKKKKAVYATEVVGEVSHDFAPKELADYGYGPKKVDGVKLTKQLAAKRQFTKAENEELLQELCVPKKMSNGKINYLSE